MRAGRLPALHWVVSENRRSQSLVPKRPRETHLVHQLHRVIETQLPRIDVGIAGGLRRERLDCLERKTNQHPDPQFSACRPLLSECRRYSPVKGSILLPGKRSPLPIEPFQRPGERE